MSAVLLDNIPFQIKTDALMKRLRVDQGSRYGEDLIDLVHDAKEVAKPKALYKVLFIESRDDHSVVVDGITLKSRVLRVNLEEVHRIFPFVATCGTELEEWVKSKNDMLHRFWAEAIKDIALRTAIRTLREHIDDQYHPGNLSSMNPGSLEDWPIDEQRTLFDLIGDIENAIGVQLTEGLVMMPTKSVSGILFPSEVNFESCQLCPREKCPGRRAPYDKDLYEKKYKLQ